MRKAAALAALLLLAGCAGGSEGRPALAETGAPAPQLRLTGLLNAPVKEIRGWDELKGRVVMLQFWATWCEECKEPMARFSALAERFGSDRAVFIAVTDENGADVRKYLKDRPVRGWVAPGAGPEIFRAFKVYGRPYAVLVSTDGRVAELNTPGASDEENIRRLLAGAAPALPGAISTAAASSGAGVLAEFSISEASRYGGSANSGADSLNATGMPLRYAFDFVYGHYDKFYIMPGAERTMNAYYDMRIHFPEGRGDAVRREFFARGLETALGLKVKDTQREADVYVLKVAPGGPLNLTKRDVPAGAECDGKGCRVQGGSFALLASGLEKRLGRPVFDETGVRGGCTYVFDFQDGDLNSITGRLKTRLGLRLEQRKRKIRVLEVSRPEP